MPNLSSDHASQRRDQMERHVLARRMVRRVPYRTGLFLFDFALRMPGLKRIWKKMARPLFRLQKYFDAPPPSEQQCKQFLQANFLSNWRLHALAVAPDNIFNRYVSFTNLAVLDKYVNERGVVLCNSHFGVGKLVALLMARQGYSLMTLDRVNSYNFRVPPDWSERLQCLEMGQRHQQNFLLKALFKCQRALNKKRIVQIIADGYRGESGVTLDFMGKQRVFRSSFAQLAVEANAVVIPVTGVVNAHGQIEVTFFEPTDTATFNGTNNEKVARLCRDYASWLAELWQQQPQSVFKNDIQQFFNLPPTSDKFTETQQQAQA